MPITTPNYYAVANPLFQRAMRNILSITQDNPALITTTYDGINPAAHQYMDGLIVRLRIPKGFGMEGIDEFQGIVTVINDTQFTLPLDTTTLNAFVVPAYQPGNNGTPAQVVPIGEISSLLTGATQNVSLPGTSF